MTTKDFEREAATMRPMLLAVANTYLGSPEDAEDTAQEVLLKLWNMADTLKCPAAPLAKVLVRNLCVDRLRRHRPTVPVEERVMSIPASADAAGETFDHVMKLIDTLPAAMQVVLRLRHIEGMSMKDIADLTGSSETSVRKALSRARIAVRKHYLNDLNDEKS